METRAPLSNTSRVAGLVAAVLIVGALYFAQAILVPLALAVLVSFVLAPLADRLERLRIGRILSAVLVVILTFVLVLGIAAVVTSQAVQLSLQAPAYKENLVAKVRDLRGVAGGRFKRLTTTMEDVVSELNVAPRKPGKQETPASEVTAAVSGQSSAAERQEALPVRVVEMPATPLAHISAFIGPVLAPFAHLGVVATLVMFILLRREDLRYRFIELVGRTDIQASTEALTEATQRVGRYLRTTLLINAFYGGVVALGLYLLGLPNPLLWGALGMMLRFLPYVGAFVSALMPITLSVVSSSGWYQPLGIVVLFVVIELVVNGVLEPWFYGATTGISPLGVILAAMFWTWLWGPVGLVVSMPLTVCLVVAASYIPQLQFLAVLLGEKSNLSPEERIYQRLLAFDEEEASELAAAYLKTASIEQFYDQVLLPTLHMAKADSHSGRLSAERTEYIMAAIQDLIDEADSSTAASDVAPPPHSDQPKPHAQVHCIAPYDEASGIASTMVERLLQRKGFNVRVGAAEALATELVDHLDQNACDVVVVSILPPLAIHSGRYLLKKLRARLPDVPVIVGLWQGNHMAKAQRRVESDGASDVVFSVSDAVLRVQQAATRVPAQQVTDIGGTMRTRVDRAATAVPR